MRTRRILKTTGECDKTRSTHRHIEWAVMCLRRKMDINDLALSSYRSAEPSPSCASTVVYILISYAQHNTLIGALVMTAPKLYPLNTSHPFPYTTLYCTTLCTGPLLVQKCSLTGESSFASASPVLWVYYWNGEIDALCLPPCLPVVYFLITRFSSAF